jgi:hypothetical protein
MYRCGEYAGNPSYKWGKYIINNIALTPPQTHGESTTLSLER